MKPHAWLVFLILGLLILLFAAYNAFYIPALDPADPDQGWAWLTTDPEIIDYIKFNFRNQGLWIFAFGLQVLVSAVGGLRRSQPWAWLGLCSVPLALTLMVLRMPWTVPVLIIPLVAATWALLSSRPTAGHPSVPAQMPERERE